LCELIYELLVILNQALNRCVDQLSVLYIKSVWQWKLTTECCHTLIVVFMQVAYWHTYYLKIYWPLEGFTSMGWKYWKIPNFNNLGGYNLLLYLVTDQQEVALQCGASCVTKSQNTIQ